MIPLDDSEDGRPHIVAHGCAFLGVWMPKTGLCFICFPISTPAMVQYTDQSSGLISSPLQLRMANYDRIESTYRMEVAHTLVKP